LCCSLQGVTCSSSGDSKYSSYLNKEKPFVEYSVESIRGGSSVQIWDGTFDATVVKRVYGESQVEDIACNRVEKLSQARIRLARQGR
jgi:hypothetical protein